MESDIEFTPAGVKLSWCPKCPSGIGIATGNGSWKCDLCPATGREASASS